MAHARTRRRSDLESKNFSTISLPGHRSTFVTSHHCLESVVRRRVLPIVACLVVAALTMPSAVADPRAIARVWHGRVMNSKADEYQAYLVDSIQVFRSLEGNLGFEVYRDTQGTETDFMVVSYWKSLDAVHAFAGADVRQVHALARDREFLIDPEAAVHNYDIVEQARP
jgi:heme-degrading monooxygenase HmoA